MPAGSSRRTCSPACKTAAWRRDHPGRPAGPPRTKTPDSPTQAHPQPAAVRDCPHCGKPVAIVALLTTPQIAGPQLATGTPAVIPPHPVRAV